MSDDRGEKGIPRALAGLVNMRGGSDAWYTKESVRDICQIGDPQVAAEFTHRCLGTSEDRSLPAEVNRLGSTIARWATQDRQLGTLSGRDDRTHRSFEQSDQVNQTSSVRVLELRQLPNPSTSLRRQPELATANHPRSPTEIR